MNTCTETPVRSTITLLGNELSVSACLDSSKQVLNATGAVSADACYAGAGQSTHGESGARSDAAVVSTSLSKNRFQ